MSSKTIVLFVAAFLCCIAACKKNSITLTATIEDITIESRQIQLPDSIKTIGKYPPWMVLAGNKLYYAGANNDTTQPAFMQALNIDNNTLANLPALGQLCACGYISRLTHNAKNLFYIANYAYKYVIDSSRWITLNYPYTVEINNGETGVASLNDKIYFLGGREASNRMKYFDIGKNSWQQAPDMLYNVTAPATAVSTDKIYVLGGDSSRKKFSAYHATSGWQAYNDLPFEAPVSYRNHLATVFKNRYIFVLNGSYIMVYDIQTEKWKTTPVATGIADKYLNLFNYNNNQLYVAGVSNSNKLVLYQLTVNNLPQ